MMATVQAVRSTSKQDLHHGATHHGATLGEIVIKHEQVQNLVEEIHQHEEMEAADDQPLDLTQSKKKAVLAPAVPAEEDAMVCTCDFDDCMHMCDDDDIKPLVIDEDQMWGSEKQAAQLNNNNKVTDNNNTTVYVNGRSSVSPSTSPTQSSDETQGKGGKKVKSIDMIVNRLIENKGKKTPEPQKKPSVTSRENSPGLNTPVANGSSSAETLAANKSSKTIEPDTIVVEKVAAPVILIDSPPEKTTTVKETVKAKEPKKKTGKSSVKKTGSKKNSEKSSSKKVKKNQSGNDSVNAKIPKEPIVIGALGEMDSQIVPITPTTEPIIVVASDEMVADKPARADKESADAIPTLTVVDRTEADTSQEPEIVQGYDFSDDIKPCVVKMTDIKGLLATSTPPKQKKTGKKKKVPTATLR